MPQFYFKSGTPEVQVYASGGELVKWETVDGVLGYFMTLREATAKCLRKLIEDKRGGLISEITKEEYEDWLGKSRGAPRWARDREYLAQGRLHPQRVPLSDLAAVAADEPAPAPVTRPAPTPSPAPSNNEPSVPAEPAEPVVRRRGRAPKAE